MNKKANKKNKNTLIQNFLNQIQGTMHKKSKLQQIKDINKKLSNKR